MYYGSNQGPASSQSESVVVRRNRIDGPSTAYSRRSFHPPYTRDVLNELSAPRLDRAHVSARILLALVQAPSQILVTLGAGRRGWTQ